MFNPNQDPPRNNRLQIIYMDKLTIQMSLCLICSIRISNLTSPFFFFSSGYNQPATPFPTVISAFKLPSTFGGPECRLGLPGEAG